jgi:hypothetical protein
MYVPSKLSMLTLRILAAEVGVAKGQVGGVRGEGPDNKVNNPKPFLFALLHLPRRQRYQTEVLLHVPRQQVSRIQAGCLLFCTCPHNTVNKLKLFLFVLLHVTHSKG